MSFSVKGVCDKISKKLLKPLKACVMGLGKHMVVLRVLH